MEKEKVEEVMNWPTLQCIKDVQKFLELANYYWQFVKDFTKITKPLHQLVRKEEKWKWERKQEEAFAQLKEIFTTKLVLVSGPTGQSRIPLRGYEVKDEENSTEFPLWIA